MPILISLPAPTRLSWLRSHAKAPTTSAPANSADLTDFTFICTRRTRTPANLMKIASRPSIFALIKRAQLAGCGLSDQVAPCGPDAARAAGWTTYVVRMGPPTRRVLARLESIISQVSLSAQSISCGSILNKAPPDCVLLCNWINGCV